MGRTLSTCAGALRRSAGGACAEAAVPRPAEQPQALPPAPGWPGRAGRPTFSAWTQRSTSRSCGWPRKNLTAARGSAAAVAPYDERTAARSAAASGVAVVSTAISSRTPACSWSEGAGWGGPRRARAGLGCTRCSAPAPWAAAAYTALAGSWRRGKRPPGAPLGRSSAGGSPERSCAQVGGGRSRRIARAGRAAGTRTHSSSSRHPGVSNSTCVRPLR